MSLKKVQYVRVPETNAKMKAEIIKLAKGLIEIAELAMPDTYLATDSRVKLARRLLKLYGN